MSKSNKADSSDTSVYVVAQSLNDAGGKSGHNYRKPADFETAITATKFGKFNIILLLIAVPAGWSSIFETTTMSYVFPAAQCDLNLTLPDKGLLNSITYAGMITSAFVWGFLCDTLGRKKLLCIGFFIDALFVIMSAMSQNATMLMVCKYLGGFIINGPFAALTTYVSEFHCAKHRARIQMILGLTFSSGTVALPLLAWAVLPLNLNFSIFQNSMVFHSWNLYLLICALPAMTSFLLFIFMPESPKFLMTTGRNEQALAVFRKVFSTNSGLPPESYPVDELVDEIKLNEENAHSGQVTANRSKVQALLEGWQQMRPLFFPPHLCRILLVCSMQMLCMMSINTLRLWLPQIFQAINDYQYYNNGTSTSLCEMIQLLQPHKVANKTEECVVNLNNASVYINSIIVSVVTIGGYIVAGILINKLGKKRILNYLAFISGVSAMALYFAQNSATVIALTSIFVALASICLNVTLAVVVDLFPTTLRTMTVSLTMMSGRIGPMIGNVLFPVLLGAGCAAPFFTVGFIIMFLKNPPIVQIASGDNADVSFSISRNIFRARLRMSPEMEDETSALSPDTISPRDPSRHQKLYMDSAHESCAFLSCLLPNTDLKPLV